LDKKLVPDHLRTQVSPCYLKEEINYNGLTEEKKEKLHTVMYEIANKRTHLKSIYKTRKIIINIELFCF